MFYFHPLVVLTAIVNIKLVTICHLKSFVAYLQKRNLQRETYPSYRQTRNKNKAGLFLPTYLPTYLVSQADKTLPVKKYFLVHYFLLTKIFSYCPKTVKFKICNKTNKKSHAHFSDWFRYEYACDILSKVKSFEERTVENL